MFKHLEKIFKPNVLSLEMTEKPIKWKKRFYKNELQSSLVYFKSCLFRVSFISSRASPVFQVLRSPPSPTISLSRDALRSARKKSEEWRRGAFSRYGNWGSGGDPSRLEINKTLSFRDTWNTWLYSKKLIFFYNYKHLWLNRLILMYFI